MPYNQPNWDYWTNPYNAGSAQGAWAAGNAWQNAGAPYDWQQAAFDPTNPFGQTMYNPAGQAFQITPEMVQREGQYGQERGDAWLAGHGWVSPGSYRGIEIGGQQVVGRDSEGNLTFNFNPLMGMFGNQSGGSGNVSGYDFTDMPAFTPYTPGEIPQVGPYEVSDFAQNIVDTNAVINAALPGIYEQQDIGFANAAARAGQSGMAMSTPYTEALGGVARKSANDIAALTEAYRYNASEALADRRMQEELQQRELEQAAWEAQQQMNMQAQMANQQNMFNAWNAQNQYGLESWLAQNQLGMQDYWSQQDLNQQNQQSQQELQAQIMAQMMSQIMGSLPTGMP